MHCKCKFTFFPEENFTRAVVFVSNPAEDPLVSMKHVAVWRGRDVDAAHLSLALNTIEHVFNMSEVSVTEPPCSPHAPDRGEEEEEEEMVDDDETMFHPHYSPVLHTPGN